MDNRENFLFFINQMAKAEASFDGLNEPIKISTTENEDISNPIVEVETSLNKLYNNIQDTSQTLSYSGYSPSTNIGFAELFGRRSKAEDRIAFGVIAHFEALTEEQRIAVLKNTVTKLAQLAELNGMSHTGSTLCMTVTCGNKIYTANVGDSTAFLMTLDKDGQSKCKRLNTVLHNPSDPSEKKRLESTDKTKFVKNNRILGLLLSRSIGDTILKDYGVISDADVYVDSVNIPEDGTGIIIVACDGLTERDCLVLSKAEGEALGRISIQSLIEESYPNNPEQIARSLGNQAYDTNSGDNISVLITKVDLANIAKYMVIFDGHGGVACADLLRKNMHTMLINETLKMLNKPNASFNL